MFFLFLVFVLCAGWDISKFRKTTQDDQVYCRRRFRVSKLHPGFPIGTFHTYIFWAVRACKEKKEQNKVFTAVRFVISSFKLPYFHLAGFRADKNGDVGMQTTDAMGFSLKLAFLRLIEYKDTNGVAGYQPGEDTRVAWYDMWNKPKYRRNTTAEKTSQIVWSTVTVTPPLSERVEGDPVMMDFRLIKDAEFIGSVYFSVVVTPRQVEDHNTNQTAGRKPVITPNSLKLNMRIEGIEYQDPDSTGMALAVAVITKHKLRKRTRKTERTTAGQDVDYPEDPSDDQEVEEVPMDDEEEKEGGFFSFKKFILAKKRGESVSTVKSVHREWDNSWSIDTRTNHMINQANGNLQAGYTARLVWFSFDDRPEEIIWDPTMGFFDSGSSLTLSLLLVFSLFLLF